MIIIDEFIKNDPKCERYQFNKKFHRFYNKIWLKRGDICYVQAKTVVSEYGVAWNTFKHWIKLIKKQNKISMQIYAGAGGFCKFIVW